MVTPWKLFGRLGNTLFQMAYIYAQSREGKIPDIYVQDEKYFKKYKGEIKTWFGQDIGWVDQVSIHVRRGDYVNNPFYVDLSKSDYYERAMKFFPDADFLVFSDDIEWCKRQDVFEGCEFSEGLSDLDDFNLMASCNGHIIANSSYSWWAAYLGNGKVIAPRAWYTDGVERTVVPSEWKRI